MAEDGFTMAKQHDNEEGKQLKQAENQRELLTGLPVRLESSSPRPGPSIVVVCRPSAGKVAELQLQDNEREEFE